MKIKFLSYLILTIVFLVVIYFSLSPSLAHNVNKHNAELESVTLQLKWKHQFQFAGYYAAIAKGYYKEIGLNVTLKEAPEYDIEPAKIVLKGDAEFGIATSDLILLKSQNQPVVALAAIYQHSPLILLSLANQGIDNVHELVGKKLMLEHHATELLAYLQQEQVPIHKITQIPHSFNVASLINKEVDAMSAYSTDEPFFLQQADIPYQVFNPRSGGIDFYGDTLFTTEQYIKQHPQQVRNFVKASLKGWEYALRNPEEIIDLILTQYSQRHSREHLQFEAEMTQRLILTDIVSLGYMNEGRWRHIAESYANLGMISGKIALDGFIFSLEEKPNLTWLYFSLLITLLTLLIVSIIANKFYKINARIKLEIQDRIEAEAEIRKLEKRYRVLAENAPFAVVITKNPEGSIYYVNQRACQQFDISCEEALKTNVINFYANPEDRIHLLTTLNEQKFIQNYELELKTSKQLHFWANVSATLITFDENSAIFVAVMDITLRKRLEQQLERMAMTDELTQVYNRRYFIQRGNQELSRSQRYQIPFSLLMIDIDYFKKINDTFGHSAGDIVLKYVSYLLSKNIRNNDILGRLGGEEFAILLPNTCSEHAMILAQRICQNIADNPLKISEALVKVTISVGCATYQSNITTFDQLLKRADIALYKAKEKGRNCVVEFQD